ncbi:MAG: cytochrome c [Vicingaceae bacterium]|nr:cytochrome c [Vicingaceae bacterium]
MDKSLSNKNKMVMAFLAVMFVIYNAVIYTQGTSNNTPLLSEKALKGEQLYQENNCTACHQFYGLGGYLGPDLTNISSTPNKGDEYIKAFLNSGVKSMPKFNFSEDEKEAIVQFLKEVDQTGYYPHGDAEKKPNGWVKIKYKNQ